MANRLHIVTKNKQENDSSDKKSRINLGLQDYISELLIEPVKENKTSSLKAIEKTNIISSMVLSNDRSRQYRGKLFEEEKLTSNNEPKIELTTQNSLTEENLENIKNKKTQVKTFSEPDPRLEKVSKLLEKIATLPLQKNDIETENSVENEVKVEANEKRDIVHELKEEQEQKQNEQIQTTNESSFVQREKKSLRDS